MSIVFKGATRPACVYGIPVGPAIGAVITFLMLALWVWGPILVFLPVVLLAFREITKQDDQAFRQLQVTAQTRCRAWMNRRAHGGLDYYSTVDDPSRKTTPIWVITPPKDAELAMEAVAPEAPVPEAPLRSEPDETDEDDYDISRSTGTYGAEVNG